MQILTFTCRVITPMFLAGANGTEPELRAASIKGAMRFWWRAIQAETDIKTLREAEADIFGGAGVGDDGKDAKRSKVIVRVTETKMEKCQKPFSQDSKYSVGTPGTDKKANILEYLAYGPVSNPPTMGRAYFDVGSTFKIIISTPPEHIELIQNLIALISFFGGLGSRSRNGYGCFSVDELADKTPESIFKQYKKNPKNNYTCFSTDARLFCGTALFKDKDVMPRWEDILLEIGKAYRIARLGLEGRHKGNERKYVSQPFSIFDPKTKQSTPFPLRIAAPTDKDPNATKSLERHAKPLFIGVHKQADNSLKGYILYLPHEFKGAGSKDGEQYKIVNDKLATALLATLTEVTEV